MKGAIRSSTKPRSRAESSAVAGTRRDALKVHPMFQTPWTGCFILIFVGGIGGLLTGWLILELVPWSLDIPFVPVWFYVPLAAIGAAPPIVLLCAVNALMLRLRPVRDAGAPGTEQ
jgi:hypothetical protein